MKRKHSQRIKTLLGHFRSKSCFQSAMHAREKDRPGVAAPTRTSFINLIPFPKRFHFVALNLIMESQYGFRCGRGTIDAIFTVRHIMQKAKARKIDLHFNFIDFKAAFDTVWRKALWKMLRAIGIGVNSVNIIENLYDDTECSVVINGHIINWFKVNVGVRQGCLLSPTLFNIFLWMRYTVFRPH